MNVALIGPGLVGSAVLAQISQLKTSWPRLNLVAIANSRRFVTGNHAQLDLLDAGQPYSLQDMLNYLGTLSGPCAVVDCTSSDALAELYPLILSRGISIITANKKPFSMSLDLWTRIFQHPLVFHESSVGAGLPVISTLNDLIDTGDTIVKIEGILSGTLSYVFNNYSSPVRNTTPFSEIIKQAKSLGYTEPDPRDDLNGVDVARKVLILARLSGIMLSSLDDIQIDNIVPVELRQLSQADFMEKLNQHDAHFEQLKTDAEANYSVIRYVGCVEPSGCSVKLQQYPLSHPFAQLQSSDNIIAIYTKRYGQTPLIIQGAGAGAQVTAHGVVSDLLKCARIVTYAMKK